MTKTSWIVLAVSLLVAPASAQQFNQTSNDVEAPSVTCASTYTSGSGLTFFQWCVTSNGNLISIQSPEGEEHILLTAGEGYQICDTTSSTVSYRDYAGLGASTNWKNSVITQPNGANTFPLTIKRTTSDGKYTLTQKFTQVPATFTVNIAMTVKNNATSAAHLVVYRVANLDIDGGGSFKEDWFDFGANAAWGYLQFLDGVMLSTSSLAISHAANVTQTLPSDCTFPSATTPAHFDGGVYLIHGFDLAAKTSTTLNIAYRRF
jgi:hypothetical protein